MTGERTLIKPKATRLSTLRGLFKEELDIAKASAFLAGRRKQ